MKPSSRPALNLERLSRTDLEALAAFKLWEEMSIDLRECNGAIETADHEWLLAFVKHGGEHIAMTPLDAHALLEARRHAAQRIAA